MIRFLAFLAGIAIFSSCAKDPNPPSGTEASLKFQFRFDADQQRLNNIGLPAGLPAGHAALTPDFQELSVHYIELAPNALTLLGQGAIVYHAEETNKGGMAIAALDKDGKPAENETTATMSSKQVAPGADEWGRDSVTYQNYDVRFNVRNIPVVGDLIQQKGTVASFVGFNTYISTVTPRSKTLQVNDDKKQGFWAFETNLSAPYDLYNSLTFGEAPAGSTTVVNPLFNTSPIPAGSCVVTGKFDQPLVVSGTETADITITLSFSINNSFEWIDTNGNGQIDLYADQSQPNEQIVDMGLRGLIPFWE